LVLDKLAPGGRWLVKPNRGQPTDFVLDVGHWNWVLSGARAELLDSGTLLVRKDAAT